MYTKFKYHKRVLAAFPFDMECVCDTLKLKMCFYVKHVLQKYLKAIQKSEHFHNCVNET